MLTRRIRNHFIEQNWGAVFLDFVIVVLGILLALQVDQWKSDYDDRQHERRVLVQLQSDFQINAERVKEMELFHQKQIDDLAYVIENILTGTEAIEDKKRFNYAVMAMFQLPPLGDVMAGYHSVMASGDFALISDPEIKSILVALDGRLKVEQSLLEFFRQIGISRMSMMPELVEVRPNSDRSDTEIYVNHALLAQDNRWLTIIATQQRTHRVFLSTRSDIANSFSELNERLNHVLSSAR